MTPQQLRAKRFHEKFGNVFDYTQEHEDFWQDEVARALDHQKFFLQRESEDLRRAIIKLSQIVDTTHVTQDIKMSATAYVNALAEDQKTTYIRQLEEKIRVLSTQQ